MRGSRKKKFFQKKIKKSAVTKKNLYVFKKTPEKKNVFP